MAARKKQDLSGMLEDGLSAKRRENFRAAERLLPPELPPTLEECLAYLDSLQVLRPNPPNKEIAIYSLLKL